MALIGCNILVLFFLNRGNAILIGCRRYKNAQPPFQEQINEIGMLERAKAKLFPSLGHFFVQGTFLALWVSEGAP